MGNAETKAAAEAGFRARLAELGATLLEPYQGRHHPHRAKCAAGHECFPRPGDVVRGGNPCRACAGRSPAWTEARFRARLAELGATLLEPYQGRHHPHRAKCAAGHECFPRPGEVLKGANPCGACAGRSPAWSEAKFRVRVAELGGEVLEPTWLGTHVPHRVRCAAGHVTTPLPGNVIAGSGCFKCAGADPAAAEARFRARLAELGATLLEPYQGANTPHRAKCAAGHECSPRPSDAMRGGICRTCAGQDPSVAEAGFRTRLAKLGATLLEPRWLGSNVPHRVRCAAGHECRPRPGGVRSGQGVCPTCAGHDPTAAEVKFRARVAELGGEVLGPYRGGHTPVRVRCAAGHDCRPHPSSVMAGRGFCRTCAGQDPAVAEAAFRARLAELGATLLEPYQGNHCQHQVRCAAGHICTPTPGGVRQGAGICRACAGQAWDVFYVVADPAVGRIKIGITAGDGRLRLAAHRRAGYGQVVRLLTGLPGKVAPEIETAARATLALAGVVPVKGREYYDISALAIVLDVADSWPFQAANLSTATAKLTPSAAPVGAWPLLATL